MKIKKRREPVDFSRIADEGAAEGGDAPGMEAQAGLDLQPEAEPDSDLDVAPAPLAEPGAEASAEPIPEPGPEPDRPALELQPPPEPAPPATAAPTMPSLAREDEPSIFREPRGRRAEGARAEARPPAAWQVYGPAALMAGLWACAPIAFALGYSRELSPFEYEPFALAVFALLALGPAAFVLVAAYLIRQGQKLSAETRRARLLADEMTAPALLAAARAGEVVALVREEIDSAGRAAHDARDHLAALREALAAETESLVEAAARSSRTARELTQALGRERADMNRLAGEMDLQAAKVADAISQQAKMVAQASELAETQLREAEAALAARAADLAAAAGEAGDAARIAGEDLTRHIARLETAGAGVAEQVSAVETGLTEQRAALVAVAHGLRAEHETFAAEAETQTAKLTDFIGQAHAAAAEMAARSIQGAEQVRESVERARSHFQDLSEAGESEREAFAAALSAQLEQLRETAASERRELEAQVRAAVEALARAAEESRAAAARQADLAREQVDHLSEAAFAAGQQANQVFDARLEEARALIEESVALVEKAGQATARKLEEGAERTRATLAELEGLLGDLEARAAGLPAAAQARAEEVREAVAASIDNLMDQARRTAEETQAIDQAFQDRVRKNYEMLSEAVRLMGSVSSQASQALQPPKPRQALRPNPEPDLELDRPVERPPERLVERPPERSPERAPERSRAARPSPASAAEAGLRPRLRLTPTATDEEFSQVFEAASGRPEPRRDEPEGESGLTWKDLLSSIDGPVDSKAARLEQTLAREIAGMGIDPAALLTRGRVEELAAIVQTGDYEGAREVVRRLAPAAGRRLQRRLFTDDAFKRQAAAFLAHYQGRLEDAAERDAEGFAVQSLLGSEAGRAYLLLEAAAGDLV